MPRRRQTDNNLPVSVLASCLYAHTLAVTWGAKLRSGILGLLRALVGMAPSPQPVSLFFLSLAPSYCEGLSARQSEGPRSAPPLWLSLGLQGEYLLRHPALGRPALGKQLMQPWKEIPGSHGTRRGRVPVRAVGVYILLAPLTLPPEGGTAQKDQTGALQPLHFQLNRPFPNGNGQVAKEIPWGDDDGSNASMRRGQSSHSFRSSLLVSHTLILSLQG